MTIATRRTTTPRATSPSSVKASGKPLRPSLSACFERQERTGQWYGTHAQEPHDSSSSDEDAAKPYMDRCKLGRLLGLFVDTMVEEAQEKLDDHQERNQQTDYLVRGVEIFALTSLSARGKFVGRLNTLLKPTRLYLSES